MTRPLRGLLSLVARINSIVHNHWAGSCRFVRGSRFQDSVSLAGRVMAMLTLLCAASSLAGAMPQDASPTPTAVEETAAKDETVPKPESSPAPAPAGSPAPAPAGQLPWSNRDLQAKRPKTPREMLRLFDIGESQLRSLFDGEPLGPSDEETLTTFLYRFPRMGEETIFSWRTPTTLEQVAEDPAEYRGTVIHIQGTLRKMEQRQLLPELKRLYGFGSYWLLTVEPAKGDPSVLVCTRNLPRQWSKDAADDLDYSIELDGFFLKTGSPDPAPTLIFAASRVEWRPAAPRPSMGITPSHVLLSKHGMDAGWLAVIRDQNGKPLGAEDRIAFYEMLAAAKATTTDDILSHAPRKADLAGLLVEPKSVHGELLKLKVRAARVTRLVVKDSDVQTRFGIDHYYQIDAFLPLGEQSVRLGTEQDAPEYQNAFPITLCMVDLPDSLQDMDERMAAGESPTEVFERELLVDGYFFRIWSYRSSFIDNRTPGKLQPAPMVLAARVRLVDTPNVNADTLSLVFGVGFVALLALVSGVLWWTSRRDVQVEKAMQERRFHIDEPLDQLDLPGTTKPDFSKLVDDSDTDAGAPDR